MFTLFRSLPLRRIAREQAPPLAGAWLLAEFFYKFHSFTLECGAFLLTWFVLDAALQAGLALRRPAAVPAGAGGRPL
jgi:hypothetical protein